MNDILPSRGHFEIVSLTGTVPVHGSHLHITISNPDGCTKGRHLVPDCRVSTNAEIVLASFPHLVYQRLPCIHADNYQPSSNTP